MLRKSLYIFVFLKLLNLAELVDPCDLGSYPTDPTLIKTKSGFVQGACTQVSINDPDKESRVANVLTWLGVPFAEPPVGPLRFMRTQPGSKWRGIRTAFNFSDICMQSGWHKHMSEDCLYLNIYAPLKQSNKNPLPIYVYFN
jgi:para-nitrobenzyl esterase